MTKSRIYDMIWSNQTSRIFVPTYFAAHYDYAQLAFLVDSRTTSGAGSSMRRGGRVASDMRSRNVLYAMCAMSVHVRV